MRYNQARKPICSEEPKVQIRKWGGHRQMKVPVAGSPGKGMRSRWS